MTIVYICYKSLFQATRLGVQVHYETVRSSRDPRKKHHCEGFQPPPEIKIMSTTGTGNPERIYNSRLTGDIFHQKMLLW